jgi:prolyl oligopeptidase
MPKPISALFLAAILAPGCAHEAAAPAPQTAPAAIAASDWTPGPRPDYPATVMGLDKDRLHGVDVNDPYRWLEKENAPEVQTWMAAQNGLARSQLDKLPGRDALANRFKELYYLDTLGVPQHRGNRYFYNRRHATKEKAIIYWKEGKGGLERVLLDPNTWSTDGSQALGTYRVSWDGKTVAYTVKQNNSDEATLYVMDVATGKKRAKDVIPGAKYAQPSWTPRGDGFYYTWIPTDPKIPTSERPGYAEVRFHKLGDDPAKDAVVRERTGDPKTFLWGNLSRDGRWLLVTIQHGWAASDVYFRDMRKRGASVSKGDWKPLAVGEKAIFNVAVWKDQFYVTTNHKAPRWQMLKVDPTKPAMNQWQTIVPENKDATLDDFGIVGGKLALSYIKDAATNLEIRELDGKMVRQVPLPAIGSAFGPSGNPDEDEAYFAFTSFTFPTEIYETSISTGKTTLWHRLSVPVDPAPYQVEQLFATSRDGTKVPLFVVHRKDLKKDGSNPTLLYGYGGFQVALTPTFNPGIFPWLERGGLYVMANLRGGSEYGESWHEQGMMLKKQNVFDDFIAVAEHLIRQGYTRPERLAIQGGSNGGLLVGAAVTQRPDLFRAAVCAVPLLDMVRYHLYGSGKTWISEYGSAEDPEQFKALLAYSPYHRVKAGVRYPSVLMLSADSDDRVDPMHARKFTAALQAASKGGPVLLRLEKNAGHGGADMVKSQVEKATDTFSFLWKELGGGAPASTVGAKGESKPAG